ncbi:MAG TPA: 30S ribosomal protein S8 [Candidatus Veblenbacteria bacterium]|nr:30S ribosomal protein S8 [Candidatus Veblenbacteria bacterium]HCX39353.1 30S ribosomal protein S8 [Candidatus Veblenbacteria bacterium]
MTDPISDMLARIHNAVMVHKTEVLVPHSRLKAAVADILVREGYIESSEEVTSPWRSLKLRLKYKSGQPAISNLKRVSKPGRRQYVKSGELPHVLSGLGIAIISTSQGLMTNREAKIKRLGGEVICEIY